MRAYTYVSLLYSYVGETGPYHRYPYPLFRSEARKLADDMVRSSSLRADSKLSSVGIMPIFGRYFGRLARRWEERDE